MFTKNDCLILQKVSRIALVRNNKIWKNNHELVWITVLITCCAQLRQTSGWERHVKHFLPITCSHKTYAYVIVKIGQCLFKHALNRLKMRQVSNKKSSRSLEHLPDLETSSTGSSYTLGHRTNSHLAISDVWSVLDKIRQSYKVDKNTKERLKQDRAAAIHKIGSGNSTTSSRTERNSIYTRATKLATLPIAENFNFADKLKPTIPFKQVRSCVRRGLREVMSCVLKTCVCNVIRQQWLHVCVVFLLFRAHNTHSWIAPTHNECRRQHNRSQNIPPVFLWQPTNMHSPRHQRVAMHIPKA